MCLEEGVSILYIYSARNLEIPRTEYEPETANLKIESSDQAGYDCHHISCVFYGMYRSEMHYILAHEKIYFSQFFTIFHNFFTKFPKFSKISKIFSKFPKISKLFQTFRIFPNAFSKLLHIFPNAFSKLFQMRFSNLSKLFQTLQAARNQPGFKQPRLANMTR